MDYLTDNLLYEEKETFFSHYKKIETDKNN